jgi:hypothetical protein
MQTRTMAFRLGTQQDALAVEVEYQDPSGIDLRLRGSRLLPMRLSVRNVSGQRVAFDPARIRLNLNGTEVIPPVSEDAVVDEIELLRDTVRYPPLLRRILPVLGGQSTAFHPGIYAQFRQRVRDVQLRARSLGPSERVAGYVFFMRPDTMTTFNSVMWLEWEGTSTYEPQMLETKGIRVRTAASEQTSFLARAQTLWNEVVHGVRPPFNKSYALLIGIGKYQHLESLQSPARDVRKMEAFLAAQGFNEIVTVEDESVTQDMLRSPQKYFTKLQPDDRFLFYYSGHGMSVPQNGRERGYLPLVGEKPGGHRQSIAMDSLVAWMKALNSRHLLVIIDACFSGLAVEGPDIVDNPRSRPVDAIALRELSEGAARYLLMAGRAGERSWGGDRWQGSLFTDALIRGLKREADMQRDRIVTTRELYVWLRDAVIAEAQKANRTLTPLLKDLGPNGVSPGDFFFVL